MKIAWPIFSGLLLLLLVAWSAGAGPGEAPQQLAGDGRVRLGQVDARLLATIGIECRTFDGKDVVVSVAVPLLQNSGLLANVSALEEALDQERALSTQHCFGSAVHPPGQLLLSEAPFAGQLRALAFGSDAAVDVELRLNPEAGAPAGAFELGGRSIADGVLTITFQAGTTVVTTTVGESAATVTQRLADALVINGATILSFTQRIDIPKLADGLLAVDAAAPGLNFNVVVALAPANVRVDLLEGLSDPRVAVLDGSGLKLFDALGAQVGATIETSGKAFVVPAGDRIIVFDDSGLRIFDLDGAQKGSTIAVNGDARVALGLDCIVVIDDDSVRIYDKNGVQQGGTIAITGGADVQIDGDRVSVADGTQTRIFDKQGNQIGPSVAAALGDVLFVGSRVMIAGADSVKIYDRDGNLINSIDTEGQATIYHVGNCIIVKDDEHIHVLNRNGTPVGKPISAGPSSTFEVDGDRIFVHNLGTVRIYDKYGNQKGNAFGEFGFSDSAAMVVDGNIVYLIVDDMVYIVDRDGNEIATVETSGRGQVEVDKNCIYVIDDNSVRIYDMKGNLLATIATSGRATVTADGDRVVIIDNTQARVYDKSGNLQGTAVAISGDGFALIDDDLIIIWDDDSVIMLDRDGNVVGGPFAITTGGFGAAEIILLNDCLLIVDDNSVRIIKRDGTQVGATIATSGRARVYAEGDRIVVIDNNGVRIYDKGTGTLQGGTIAVTGTAWVDFGLDRIVVIDDNSVRIYDRSGVQQGAAIATAGEATVKVDEFGIKVVDGNGVRIFGADGVQFGATMPAGQTPDSFFFFPDLPFDLQLQIGGNDLQLSWPHVIPGANYDVWLGNQPYFGPGTFGATFLGQVTPPPLTPLGAPQQFIAPNAANNGQPDFFIVQAILPPSDPGPVSNVAAELPLTLAPGRHLLTLPLIPFDPSLDAIFAPFVQGSADPQTASRILLWEPLSQQYDAYWFCDCPTFGPPWDGHFLTDSFEAAARTLRPQDGFWFDNRAESNVTIHLLGIPPAGPMLIDLRPGWNLLGPTFFGEQLTVDDLVFVVPLGSGDPTTADQLLLFDSGGQLFVEHFFCAGGGCPDGDGWADPDTQAAKPSPLQPSDGFFFNSRGTGTDWTEVKPYAWP